MKTIFVLFTQFEIVPLFTAAKPAIKNGLVAVVESVDSESSTPSKTAPEARVAKSAMFVWAERISIPVNLTCPKAEPPLYLPSNAVTVPEPSSKPIGVKVPAFEKFVSTPSKYMSTG